jgi:hypothetical protein
MTTDEQLRDMQRRIALAKGYTVLREGVDAAGRSLGTTKNWLTGTLHADEGPTLIPCWPWDWCAAGALVEEMEAGGSVYGTFLDYNRHADNGELPYVYRFVGAASNDDYSGKGYSAAEAISRCWCAWKGIDLSDLEPTIE